MAAIGDDDYVYATAVYKIMYDAKDGSRQVRGYDYRIMVARKSAIMNKKLLDPETNIDVFKDVSDSGGRILFFTEFRVEGARSNAEVNLDRIAVSKSISGKGAVSAFYPNFVELLINNFAGYKVSSIIASPTTLKLFYKYYNYPRLVHNDDSLKGGRTIAVIGWVPRHMKEFEEPKVPEWLYASLGGQAVPAPPALAPPAPVVPHSQSYEDELAAKMSLLKEKVTGGAEQAGSGQTETLMNIVQPILDKAPLDRAALIDAMKERANTPEEISQIISEIAENPELEMALRTAVLVKGIGNIPKNGHANIVAQLVPTGKGNVALRPIQEISGKLSLYPYNLYAKSLVSEGVDEAGLEKLLGRVSDALDDPSNADPRALLLIPASLKDSEQIANLDSRIRVQYIEQGEEPDIVSQFGLGFQMLEYDRLTPDEKTDQARYQGLVNLISAMVDLSEFDNNPAEAIRALFKKDTLIKIRRIDWTSVDEQRRAWEAVATAL